MTLMPLASGFAARPLQLLAVSLAAMLVWLLPAHAKKHAWSPWHSKNTSIIIDAYAYTPIDWGKLRDNKRLVGFINKASDGLVDPWRCKGSELQQNYCKVRWRRYKAEHELFLTRRALAKALGLKWGSYHLARPGNPVGQALHYIQYADPQPDDLIALDIEHNDPKKWMSLKDSEIFARTIKRKLGRYPMLYTNHDTAKYIARNRDKYPLLSKLNLWYARYKDRIPGVFPLGHWPQYTIWQFSSIHNCTKRRCLYRVKGTDRTVDVNVAPYSVATARKLWPFDDWTAIDRPLKKNKPDLLVAKVEPAKPSPSKTTPKARPSVPVAIAQPGAAIVARAYAPVPAKSSAEAAIGNLLAPKALVEADSDEVAIVVPKQIEDKSGKLVARLVDRAIEKTAGLAVPKPNPIARGNDVAIGAIEKQLTEIETVETAAVITLPDRVMEELVDTPAAEIPAVAPAKNTSAAPVTTVVWRSLDSAPRYKAQSKPVADWRTSDQVRDAVRAR
ncbi:GH25 family lysozyme [Pseudahrensia aquimaris]|uniref:GH25 family lysozyme n=1 Tax=Pseudahrensia aquimaris TaxID=744461 RepID=A0ABW3FJE7_9HYPH